MTVSLTSESLPSTVPRAPLTVCIHLDILKANFKHIRQFVPGTTEILPIIKADAYGHGAVAVAQALESFNIFGFGVASVTEGIRLRDHGIHSPIIIMGPLLKDHVHDIIHYHLTPVISHHDIFHQLLAHLPSNAQPFPIHLKIDTGLHRLGFEPKEALALLSTLPSTPASQTSRSLNTFCRCR